MLHEVGKVTTHRFKLVVGKDDGNPKSSGNICANERLKVLDDVAVLQVIQFTS